MQFKNKLAIFDLDGTLFDTKDVNYYSYKEALSKFQIDLDYDFFCKNCNGKKYTQFLPQLSNLNNQELKIVHDIKKKLYSKYIDKAKINKSLFDIMAGLMENYYIALVTTASKNNTYEILEYFNKKDCFDLILTQDDIENPKPNPEGFLKAMNFFSISKDNVIIFEDSDVGLEAAKLCSKIIYKCYGYN